MGLRIHSPGWLKIVAAGLLLLAAVAVYLLRVGADVVGGSPSGDRLARIEQSPNFVEGRFVNTTPTGTVKQDYWSKLVAYLSPDPDRAPQQSLPTGEFIPLNSMPGARITWLGHATVLIQLDSLTILTDPVFDKKLPLLFGSTERFQPPPIARDSLPPIDIILISHDHFDHLEQSSVEYFAASGAMFVVPLGIGAHLESWEIPASQIVELDWWQARKFGNTTITCTPARHLSGRSLLHMDETLWGSFVISNDSTRLFYSGDTGYSRHFEEIGDRLGPFDLTLIQIGAYDEAWPDIHMTSAQAVKAQQDLRGRLLLPVHWGTYDVALHPWKEPIELLTTAAQVESIKVVVPTLGQTVDPFSPPDPIFWWSDIP